MTMCPRCGLADGDGHAPDCPWWVTDYEPGSEIMPKRAPIDAAAIAAARADERARIVAALHGWAVQATEDACPDQAGTLTDAADAIERGEGGA